MNTTVLRLKAVMFLLVLLVASVMLTGCPPQQRPEGNQQESPSELSEAPQITVYMHENGQVATMNMEDYLEGVVAAEMDPEWPEEALAAQAIIARSFTMKKINEGGVTARGTDASTDIQEFQAYSAERVNDAVKAAVKKTRGQVAMYNDEHINAWFHADAGGITATAKEGLDYQEEEPPYIHSVEDPGQKITVEENKRWEAKFPLNQVSQSVKEITGSAPSQITSAEITDTGPSGRATTVRIGDAEVAAAVLRLRLGNDVMRSTLIDKFTIEGNQLVVSGKGYGHGVGMSQWGARAMAEDGKKAEEIVNYYFKDVEIKKLWN